MADEVVFENPTFPDFWFEIPLGRCMSEGNGRNIPKDPHAAAKE